MNSSISQSEMLNQLRQMDAYEFEKLVAEVWEERGWKTEVTTGSTDRGIDVVATRNTPFFEKQLIQAKRYGESNPVSSTEIQQYASLKHQEPDVDAVIVVTTSYFSNQAENIASDLNIKIIDGAGLYKLIDEYLSQKILEDYIQISSNCSDSNMNATGSEPDSERHRSLKNLSNSLEKSEQRPDIVDIYKKGVEVEKSNYLGEECPICGESNTIWRIQHLDKSDEFLCESCDTKWESKTEEITYRDYSEYSGFTGFIRFLINETGGPVAKLKVVEGRRVGEERTTEEWRQLPK